MIYLKTSGVTPGLRRGTLASVNRFVRLKCPGTNTGKYRMKQLPEE